MVNSESNKNAENFGGYLLPPILQIPPIIYIDFARRGPQKRPYLGPSDVLLKALTYQCSSALNSEVLGERRYLISKTLVPQQLCQKTTQIGQNSTFLFFCRVWDEVALLLEKLIAQHRTTNLRELF